MPSYDPEFFNIDPYYDDFDENKKFLKLLFRPGYSLQARELSQIQSILQNQIERFGNFVLDDGSMVYGGQITEIPTDVRYITGLSGGTISLADLTDKTVSFYREGLDEGIGQPTDGITSYAKIIYATSDPNTSEGVVYFQYMSGEGYTGSDAITIQGYSDGITFTASTTGDTEKGTVIFVDEGIRYTNGHFILHDSQKLGLFEEYPENYISSGSELPLKFKDITRSVGFNINKSIVTSEQDITLRDPASGFYNYNAPGADRYKIDLQIAQRSITGSIDTAASTPFERSDYIEFLRVVDGEVIKKEKYADLGQIEETFARRTYDESGHYIVNPFDLTTIQGPTSTQLYSKLDSGKAYVFGYEFETIGSTKLIHDKARNFRETGGLVEYDYSIGPFLQVKFANKEGGLSGIDFSSLPTIYFDSETGSQGQVFQSFDGVRFSLGPNATTKDFIPGLTLYMAYDKADLTAGSYYGASADVQVKILKVVPIEGVGSSGQYTPEGYSYINYVEVGPPFAVGSTSSFITTPFYVAAGPSFDAQQVDENFAFTGSNVSFFNTTELLGLSGGPLLNPIGSMKIRSVQRVSGNKYKLFFDNLQLTDSTTLSNVRRFYSETNLDQPAFFVDEVPTRIYNSNNLSLVLEVPYGDVVRGFTDYDFMINLTITGNFDGSSSFTKTLSTSDLAGFVQIGPNIVGSSVVYPLQNSQIVSAFTKNGVVSGDIQIIRDGGGTENPNRIVINNATVNGENVNNQFATFTIACQVNSNNFNTIRNKTLVTESATLSFTGPDSSGYYYSYFATGGNYLTDVISVDSTNPSLTGFVFDSGQKDTYYDFSKIKIFDSSITSATATVKKYNHSGNGPFVGGGADNTSSSYPNYSNIPTFYSNSGKTISLRNSMDFRPVRTGNDSSFTLVGPYQKPTFIYDNYGNSVNYSYFLPRIDKIVLTRDKAFNVIKGIPNEIPSIPADNPNSMTLYTLRFNPYTFDENDLSIVQEDNRRFTMKDIGNLERRIEKIEYYSTLNSLEQDAKNTPIYDNFGFEMPKKAFIVDQFTGTESSDVLNNDFYCGIDKENKELKPAYRIHQKDRENLSTTPISGLTSSDGIVTFPYTSVEYLSNKKYNNSRRINSNSIVDFNGTIKLTPHCDTWFSTDKQPLIKTNNEGENDSWKIGKTSFEMNSDFWETHWFGKSPTINRVLPNKTNIKRNYEKKPIATSKITSFSSPQSNLSSTPEKVIDSNVVPYCRPKNLTLKADGLKPNKVHYIFFEDTSIEPGGVTANEYGELEYTLSITGDTFPSGKKLVRIVDNLEGDISKSNSSADAIYTVSGMVKDSESQRFIRPLITKREASNSLNVTNDALTRDFQRKEKKSPSAKDNIAQIFSVSPNSHPKGLFVKSVDIYFDDYPQASPSELAFEEKLPVKVILKPVVNGYPSSSKIITESLKYQLANEGSVVTDSLGNTFRVVNFSFPYPTYLEPGDYALELQSNSSKYSIKTYVLPSVKKKEDPQERESVVDINFGNMILPKNVGKYEKTPNEVITMTLYKCKFTGNSGTITYKTDSIDKPFSLKSNLNGLLLDSRHCSISYGGISLSPNTNEKIVGTNNTDTTIQLSYIDENVSPVLDLDSTNIIFSENKISQEPSENESKPSDYIEEESDSDRNRTYSRYITKSITTLQPSKNVHVLFDGRTPEGTDIRVYLKRIGPNSPISFEDAEYIELKKITENTITNIPSTEDFKPTEYKSEVDLNDFTTFAVKILFLGDDKQKYPSLKNLKVISV